MPELPEVETVVRALDQTLKGRRATGVRLLGGMRIPFDAKAADALLRGRSVVGVRRRAKYIVIDFSGSVSLLAHLGMTGHFRVEPADCPELRHDRAVIALDQGEELRYADARRFGFVKPVTLPAPDAWPDELAALGPEPLDRAFTGRAMRERADGRKAPVKTFIMDQAVVVGVGNIYASEALFAAGIDPRRPAGSLSAAEWNRVVGEIRKTLRRAIAKGGSTIRNYRGVNGSEGGFQRSLNVYGKAGTACPVCGGTVSAIRQCGRSTFYCPSCQK